jgi:acyl-CoA synthetase (AMP-forming)/AMP-acid ligase II
MYNGRRSSCPPREVADEGLRVRGRPRRAATLAELTDFLRRERRIAPQKLPEMLQVVDALPTTMTGKVQKFLLREAAQALAHQM